MDRLELYELGSCVGWVDFDPYSYEYSGDSRDAENVLDCGVVCRSGEVFATMCGHGNLGFRVIA